MCIMFILLAAPVQESSTIYDAFLAQERKKEAAATQSSRPAPAKDSGKTQNGVAGKKTGQTKKKKADNDQKKALTLEEAIAQVMLYAGL